MSKAKPSYANIAPAMPLPAAGRQVFTYKIPDNQAVADRQIVQISVGRRTLSGVVINTHSQKPSYPTKPIKRVYNSVLTEQQLQLAQWITDVAHGSLGYTARLFFPPSLASGKSPASKANTTQLSTQTITAPFGERWHHLIKSPKQSLKDNQQTLILVPEIWMVEHLADYLKNNDIKPEHLLSYYGALKNSELTATWNAIGQGQPAVVIGTQKALLLPFSCLSHIILEEEALDSHKLWDQYPRLDNRLAARQLSIVTGAQLTLTNTYPSLAAEHLHQTQSKISLHKPLTLHPRLTEFSRQDRKSRRLLPNEFLPRLRTYYKAGDQILFLYNRRQEAEVSTKPGWQTDVTSLAEVLKKLRFPASKVLWLDAPSIAKKSPQVLTKQITNARIIVSTSAIFTQLSNHEVGRVIWLFPEQTINYPDYRSVERARITLARLQQLTPPRRSVDLLSRIPNLIQDHLLTDDSTYFDRELTLRKKYHYPPFTDVVRLTTQGKTQKEADTKAQKLRQQLQKNTPQDKQVKILTRGPYKDLKKTAKNQKKESHLLLQGPLNQLVELYKQSPTDQADPFPHQIM